MYPDVRTLATALLSVLSAACGIPKDPEGTSERIASTHELRVGVTDNPPWVSATRGEPGGIEAQLVREFAESLQAHVLWTSGSESMLVEALKRRELDVVIGGFEKRTQWSSQAGITQPFAKDADGKKHVFLAAPGENGFILKLDRFLTERQRASGGAS
jgi:ABC-type amino acid transport substrate-binding protein